MGHPTGFLLELVGFCETMTLAFEFDGIQNYKYSNPFHGTYKLFESQRRRNEMRNYKCKIYWVTLIRIKYDVQNVGEHIRYELKKKNLIWAFFQTVWKKVLLSCVMMAYTINRSRFQALCWWCWAEHPRDEDVAFHIPWARCLPFNCELNSFFRIHHSQPTSMKMIDSHTPEIDKKSEAVSGISLSHSSRCFPFQIFWRPLLTYLLSPFLGCKPYSGSIDNYLHFSDVGIKCLLTVSRTSGISLVKKKSLHWPPCNIDAFIDDRVWSPI